MEDEEERTMYVNLRTSRKSRIKTQETGSKWHPYSTFSFCHLLGITCKYDPLSEKRRAGGTQCTKVLVLLMKEWSVDVA